MDALKKEGHIFTNITHYSEQLIYGKWEGIPRNGLSEHVFKKTLNSLFLKKKLTALSYIDEIGNRKLKLVVTTTPTLL